MLGIAAASKHRSKYVAMAPNNRTKTEWLSYVATVLNYSMKTLILITASAKTAFTLILLLPNVTVKLAYQKFSSALYFANFAPLQIR